jgi:hypothetical protein
LPKKTFEAAAAAKAHLIVQLKDNQPTLCHSVEGVCKKSKPLSGVQTIDRKKRNRHEMPGGRSPEPNAVVLPTKNELRRLEDIVYRTYPRLKAGGDSDSFRAAFHRLTYTRRAERLDAKRPLDFWVDQAEDWLKAQGYYPSRPATQSFVAACVAMATLHFRTRAVFRA